MFHSGQPGHGGDRNVSSNIYFIYICVYLVASSVDNPETQATLATMHRTNTYKIDKTTQRTKKVNNKNATNICPLQDNTENSKGEQQERHQNMSITRQHRELNR